ncbi:hypothetical protein AMTRI_Chr07g27990 [Amborella trichopoda]
MKHFDFDLKRNFFFYTYQKKEDPLGSSQTAHTEDFDPEHNPFLFYSYGPKDGSKVFLNERDLKVGNKLEVYHLDVNISRAPSLLPRHEANSIPFASSSLDDILQHFSIPRESPRAKAIKETLQILESMHEFVLSIFGPEANLQVLATTMHNKRDSSPLVQAYTVQDIHVQMTLPSLVVSNAFKVKLEGEDGNKDPDHVSFKVLGSNSGGEPVCHFPTRGQPDLAHEVSRGRHMILTSIHVDQLECHYVNV